MKHCWFIKHCWLRYRFLSSCYQRHNFKSILKIVNIKSMNSFIIESSENWKRFFSEFPYFITAVHQSCRCLVSSHNHPPWWTKHLTASSFKKMISIRHAASDFRCSVSFFCSLLGFNACFESRAAGPARKRIRFGMIRGRWNVSTFFTVIFQPGRGIKSLQLNRITFLEA